MDWFDLADVHRDREMRDAFSSYRGRIARTHVKHVRHIDLPRSGVGRPQRVTLITQQGVQALYAFDEWVPKLKPYAAPMRLTDKARAHAMEPGVFTTGGLEMPGRLLDRDAFIEFLVSIGNKDLIEPDFVNL